MTRNDITQHPFALPLPRHAPPRTVAVLALCMYAAASAAQTPELGIAPQRIESQDTSGWSRAPVQKAAKTRADVAALYQSAYVQQASVPLAWSGSVAACDAGTTDLAHQQAVIARVNYFRALVDLPPVALLGATETAPTQAAALMFAANDALSHAPPPSWMCYSAAGASGAGSSNLALGAMGVDAIDLYMDDAGAGNGMAGHRRWVLFPPRAAMATGDVPANASSRPANALYVFGPSTERPATPGGIAWPPAGYVPYQNLPSQSNRWSISYPGASFANATVTMTGPNGAYPIAYEPQANDIGFGDNTLVFLPSGFSYGNPFADTTYTVTVSGLAGVGVPPTLQYAVTVIDPDAGAPPPPTSPVAVVEYYNAALDHYFITWKPEEIAALDAGVPIAGWVRTGQTFNAYATAQAGTSDVCRYYIPPGLGDSHFFGRDAAECNATGAAHPSFVLEDAQFMHLYLPVGGSCPPGTLDVYRVFSNRPDANHRYMTDAALRDHMVQLGWLAEGDGPDRVVMCAPP